MHDWICQMWTIYADWKLHKLQLTFLYYGYNKLQKRNKNKKYHTIWFIVIQAYNPSILLAYFLVLVDLLN